MGVIFGAIVLGQNASFMPNFAEASLSANRLFTLFNSKSKISPFNSIGLKPKKCHSQLTFSKAVFGYPTRPNVRILNTFDLKVEPGNTIAIVGQSGQGKSTIIQLIERFYDINQGSLKLDGNEIQDLDVNWLRQNIGLVGQARVLYNYDLLVSLSNNSMSRTNSKIGTDTVQFVYTRQYTLRVSYTACIKQVVIDSQKLIQGNTRRHRLGNRGSGQRSQRAQVHHRIGKWI